MRKIYSEFDNVSVSSECGTSEYGVYERVVNKNSGEVSLRLVKKLDLYSEIQEAGVGITLNEIIAKYESGEVMDFNFRQGQYLDLSEFPSSAIDTLNLLRGIDNLDVINNYLKSLKEFDNDINEVDNQIVLDVDSQKNEFDLKEKGKIENEKK